MPAVPTALRRLVYDRDEGRCQRCARHCLSGVHSLQHRRPRQMGGDRNANTPANLVLLCGSGTTGCHGHVEHNRTEALEQGWLVHRWDDPADIPVLRYGRTRARLDRVWTPIPREEVS